MRRSERRHDPARWMPAHGPARPVQREGVTPLLRRLQTAAAVSLLALAVSGCLTKDKFDITGSIKQPAGPPPP